MQAGTGTTQRGFDRPFFHLLRWELRFLRGRRQAAWWSVLSLLAVGVAIGTWKAATLDEDAPANIIAWRTLAIAFLMATPLHDAVANLAQMTFGYALLRFAAYTVIAFSKFMLPALAAGSVSNDRQAGRMADLQMMPIGVGLRYLAKVVAASLPFFCLGLALFVLFAGILVFEYVPLSEVVRLSLETIGQIVLAACVAVTCSALFRTSWQARVVVYLLLWVVFPACWLLVLLRTSGVPDLMFWRIRMDNGHSAYGLDPLSFGRLCQVQAGLTAILSLSAFCLGVLVLRREGKGWRKSRHVP